MARKPRDQWSDAYRRRIESAERRGLDHQRARGHFPGEARARAEREREEEGLSGYERRQVRRWAAKRYTGDGAKIDPDEAEEWARAIGYASFREFASQVRELNKQYRRELAAGTYVKGGHTQYWERLLAMYEPPEVSFGYYH